VRNGLIDKHFILKWNNVSVVVCGFPQCPTNVFHFDVSVDASNIEGDAELANGSGVNIRESVGGGVSASAVNDSTENVLMSLGGLMEQLSRVSEMLLCHGLVQVRELFGLKHSLVRSEFSESAEGFFGG